jgi:aldehyde dehydrogenase (NAD+)
VSSKTLSHYIAGEWITEKGGNWDADLNPSDTTQVLAQIPQGQPETVDRAIEAAQAGFRVWKAKSGTERANFMHRAANVLDSRRQAFGTLVAQEVGKPIGEALQEVDRGVRILRYFAEEAVHPMGQVIPAQSASGLQFSLRQPVGPVAIISPWNFPIAIPLWKLAPAIAYGNSVILKPASVASLTAWSLFEVFAEAGFPAGVVNLVLGKGSTVGNALMQHHGLSAISFTGSEDTGMRIAEVSARHNIKFQLEMGGKNSVIVLDDADVVQAAKLTAAGAMRYAGQKCTATSRVIVTEGIASRFLDQLKAEIAALPVAQATDANSAVGPLITQDSLDQVASYAEMSVSEGQVLMGGKRLSTGSLKDGYFFEPTLVTNVAPTARVAQEEIFGPLLVAHQAKDVQDAIAIANSTRFGLSAAVFTHDINAALEYIHHIDSGMVRINGDTTGVDPHAPFGGMRFSSSHSREQGPAAIEFFTEIKTVQINPAG